MPSLVLLGAFSSFSTPLSAANIVHEFYVPMPEDQVRTALVSIEPAAGIVGTTMESVVSIVVTGTATVVHYDEWEDGYEVDLNNPTQSTTKIWGDGNNANGIPPGYANDPASFSSGAVINLRNQITLPRNPMTLMYDGRDRFGGTKALVVTRTGWAVTPGTVLAGSVEVTATMDYGTSFISPVGQDVSASSMFEYVGLMMMARENGTSVTVDINGPVVAGGTTTFTLSRGQSYLVNGGVLKGATVTATKPVQTQLITGDIGARYETDWFTLYPTDQWTDTYYSPVGTAADGDATFGFFYNPNATQITINTLTCLGTGSFTVPAYGVSPYQMPQNCGARFTSAGGQPYFGIVTVGANPTANNVHDWGFTLVPSDSLTTEAVVGWGPGSSDLTQNGSPVWITPIAATRVYVDYNGDRLGTLTDPKGNKYDVHYDVGALETRRLFDPDKDQSAMRVYSLDGVQIAAAWGQDPATAGPGNPFLDVGTTVLPFPVPSLIKSWSMKTDNAPTGLSIGDVIEYRIEVDNKGLLPLGNLLVLDPLNVSLTYVANSTKRDGLTISDGSSGTLFPLDEGGYVVPIILRGGTTNFTYRCTINAAGTINNTASNSNYNLISTANVTVPPLVGSTPCGAQFTNATGTLQTAYSAGSVIYATLNDPDANNLPGTVESITVVVNNTSNGDAEFVVLTETAINTGIFRNTTGFPTSTTTGTNQMDSTLLVSAGNNLSFTYTDPEFNETCSGTATISTPTQTKVLYLSTDGSGSPDQDMDRIDPVAANDLTTATSQTLEAISGGGTITLGASKDNWINGASGNTGLNYGASTTLRIDRQGSLGEERSMLQFDLSSIPANAIITSAQLTLVKTGGPTTSQTIGVHRVTATWDEGTQDGAAGTANWTQRTAANNWTTASGDINGTAEDTVSVAANGSYSWNLTSLVQGWQSGTFNNHGVLAYSPDTGGDNPQQFGSRENTTPANRPQLIVTYTTVSFDAASTNTKLDPIGTVSVNHTTGTGSNRFMLVGISFEDDNTAGLSVTNVTYNGQPLSFVGKQLSPTEAGCEIWQLVNPPSGASSVQVTTTGSSTGDAIFVGVATFSGVHQTTPLGTLAKNSGTGTTASVTTTSALGEVVFDVLGLDDARASSTDSSQTARWSGIAGTADSDGIRASASTKSGAASVTTTWTVGSDSWALCAVPIKPASTSSSTTFTQTPNFATAFTLPAGGTTNITTYVNVTSGTLSAAPNITAVLKHGSTVFATLTNPTYNSSAGTLIWSTTLSGAVTLPSGVPIDLVITSNQTGAAFTVQYDSATQPSKVTLPTTTVITNTALAVYDAPYPGGNIITGPASGSTVYIRGTASDPFGAYDITSMGLSIDGPGTAGDISTTLNAGNVVNTTTATKTYEYAWSVGATTGNYNIVTTANEGTEGINATRSTSVNVTFLDLGTPSTTEFTTGSNGPGTPTYAGNEQVCVRIIDLDQNLNATAVETIQATITSAIGDSELITLTETGINTGIFTFCIPASTSAANTFNDGTLHAVLGDVLTVNYVDPTDSTDIGSDTATIPNIAPSISVNKTLVTPGDGRAVIGETLQYTVQVTNNGNTPLSSIAVTDSFLSSELSYVSAIPAPNTIASGSLTWSNVGPLTPGQSTVITLNFTAAATAAPAVNTASANAGGGVISTDTADVTITDPKITINKTLLSPNPGPANIGANVTFRISVTNTGTTAIATLPIEDTYSGADFDFVSATLAPDAAGNGSLLWLDITGSGNLAVAATQNIDVVLKAKGAAAPAANLAKAEYTVDVNGNPAPPVSSSATITLIAAKITGSVYHDVDQSVTFNSGDGVLDSITLSLYTDPNGDGNPADGVLIAITTSDTAGAYEFINLASGNYVVVETQPPGYSSSGDTGGANDNRIPVNVSTLTTFASRDFFDFSTPPASYASIAGKVWNDANASAAVNGGELGIADVAVDLVEDTNGNGIADPGEPVAASTLTGTDGSYSFSGLSAGNYVVVERDLFNWYSTADSTGPNNNMVPVTLSAGQNITGRDFLDVLTGTTGGKLFHDVNGNGIFDAGDIALASIDVSITDSLGSTQTVVTDSNGNWTATVPPGLTTVDVQQADPQFAAAFTMSYAQTAGTDPSNISVVSGTNTPAGDDGFRHLGRVTGHLYIDTNGNGTQDSGEPDLANIDILITDSNNATQTVGTDANGNWTATVPPGTTTADVQENDPQFPTGSTRTEGSDPTSVLAVAGVSTSAGNDGYFIPATIGNLVWHDADNDGLLNNGETGLNGVTVELLDSLGVSIDSTITAGGGLYAFANVAPGTYRLRISTPPALYPLSSTTTDTADNDEDNDDNGSQTTPTAVTLSPLITVSAGQVKNSVDFGFTALAGTYSISGQVRDDFDSDGVFTDNDNPVRNVTVRLYADTNGNGSYDLGMDALIGTTTTDGLGNYTFNGLSNGSYFAQEVDPATSTSTADKVGANDNLIPVIISGGSSIGNDFLDAVDPSGYIYSSVNGKIIAGGSISVSGPGAVTLLQDGSNGQYSWITDGTPGTYNMIYSPPLGYIIDPTRPVSGASFTPTGGANPTSLGAGENPNNAGFLNQFSASANPYYLTFVLAPGDPFVINNNIPLVEIKPTSFVGWQYANPLGGQNSPTQDPDGDDVTNLAEFAYCLNASSGINTACPLEIRRNSDGTVDARLRRLIGATGISYALEFIADLPSSGPSGSGWSTLTSITPVISANGDGTETLTYRNLATVPSLASGQGFVRPRLTLEADGSIQRGRTVGWATRNLAIGCQTCENPFLSCEIFAGVVDSITGNTLDFSTSAGGGNIKSRFITGTHYYLEVINGDQVGQRFEVDESSSNNASIALDTTSPRNTLGSSVPASLAGDRLMLRAHQTIKELFLPTEFSATTRISTADRLLFHNRQTGVFETLWLSSNNGNPVWQLVGDASQSDAGSRVLDVCQGLYVHPKGSSHTLVFTGLVRENTLSCPLLAGPNLVGNGWPLDMSPKARKLLLSDGFNGSNRATNADRFQFWKGDENAAISGYNSYFLLNSSLLRQWVLQEDASLTGVDNSPLFKTLRASFVQPKTAKPTLLIPLPWTP